MKNSFVFLFLMAILFAGCEKNVDPTTVKIHYGTSFGMCLGYCKKELLLTNQEAQFTKSGWRNDVETKTCKQAIDEEKWNALIQKIDANKFNQLKEVIGCPDCTDGGAEWIELEGEGKKHKVTFEYGKEPEEVKIYINDLREYTNQFKNCE